LRHFPRLIIMCVTGLITPPVVIPEWSLLRILTSLPPATYGIGRATRPEVLMPIISRKMKTRKTVREPQGTILLLHVSSATRAEMVQRTLSPHTFSIPNLAPAATFRLPGLLRAHRSILPPIP